MAFDDMFDLRGQYHFLKSWAIDLGKLLYKIGLLVMSILNFNFDSDVKLDLWGQRSKSLGSLIITRRISLPVFMLQSIGV